MIPIALTTQIPFSTKEIFSFAKQAGFDGIEYFAKSWDFYTYPRRIIEQSKLYKIPIISLHQPVLFVIATPAIFFPRLIKLCKQFPDLVITNHHLSGVVHMFRVHDGLLRTFLTHAKQGGITVTFESNPKNPSTLGFHPLVNRDPDLFGDFCIGQQIPITMDTSHIADHGYNIVDFFLKYHKHIRLIHLSDFKHGIQHLPLGQGDLPIKKLLQTIKKVSWKGEITLEIDRFPGARTKEEKFAFLKESLEMVRRYI